MSSSKTTETPTKTEITSNNNVDNKNTTNTTTTSTTSTTTTTTTQKSKGGFTIATILKYSYDLMWLLIYLFVGILFVIYAYHRWQIYTQYKLPFGSFVTSSIEPTRKIHYVCFGMNSNQFSFIVPGLGVSAYQYHKLMKTIALEQKVCTYDRAGLGFSPSTKEINQSQMLQDLYDVITKSPLLKPGADASMTLIGHSYGCELALSFLQHYPKLVNLTGVAFLDGLYEIPQNGSWIKKFEENFNTMGYLVPLAELGFLRPLWAYTDIQPISADYDFSTDSQQVYAWLAGRPGGHYSAVLKEMNFTIHHGDQQNLQAMWANVLSWKNVSIGGMASTLFRRDYSSTANAEWKRNGQELENLFKQNGKEFQFINATHNFPVTRTQDTLKFLMKYLSISEAPVVQEPRNE